MRIPVTGHKVKVWSVTGEDSSDRVWMGNLGEHDDDVWSIAFSPVGLRAISGGNDHKVKVITSSYCAMPTLCAHVQFDCVSPCLCMRCPFGDGSSENHAV